MPIIISSITSLRISKDLSIEKLSKLTKVDIKTIRKFEKGGKISDKSLKGVYTEVWDFLGKYSAKAVRKNRPLIRRAERPGI